ncbi:MAG TPA: SCO family protein [Cyclobacteriaceae bacterium]|nr:SCO family protein [Cyclobacteriaceae bacterium]
MKKQPFKVYAVFLTVLIFWGCSGGTEKSTLPYLGNKHTEDVMRVDPVSGDTLVRKDTVYHTIAPFSFYNQEGKLVNNQTVDGKVYVADFFFTSCPTICPVMKKQMLRVYEEFQDEPDFKILSHTIDPSYDTVALLKDYAMRLGVEDDETWHFLTGDREKIFEIGQTSYLTTAMEDKNEPGGLLHSGAFVLVDREGRIRGVYDGTEKVQVDRLIADIPLLLKGHDQN